MYTRTDFPTAVQKAFEVLKTGETFTQNQLAERTGLNFRTIQKILIHAQYVQNHLKENEISISESGSYKLIQMQPRSGLASFPENIQKMIIKTMYYPTISDSEEILVHLLLNNAISPSCAITMSPDRTLKKLIDAEYVIQTDDGRYCLTEDGSTIAIGALELYPEIRNIQDGGGAISGSMVRQRSGGPAGASLSRAERE